MKIIVKAEERTPKNVVCACSKVVPTVKCEAGAILIKL